MTPEEVRQLYKIVFGTKDAEKILEDLGARFCENASTFSTSSTETAYREGQRTVLLFIRSMLREQPQIKDNIANE